MRRFELLIVLALAGIGAAQQPGTQPAAPALMACGVHGDIEVLCGTRSPEDLELTPDGKYLIATQFVNLGRTGTTGAGMAIFDLAKKTFTKMAVTDEPDKSWAIPPVPVRLATRWSRMASPSRNGATALGRFMLSTMAAGSPSRCLN